MSEDIGITKWDLRFYDMAKLVATWSKDANKKTGAVIVDRDGIVLSVGYNGLPRGCDDTIESRFERPSKYMYVEHAERNCLYHAARHGVSLKDTIIHVTYFPCADCTRGIIQSGITKLISPRPDFNHERWGDSFKVSLEMLKEANIEVKLFD